MPTNSAQYIRIVSSWPWMSQFCKTEITLLSKIEKTGLDDPVMTQQMLPTKIKNHSGLFNASIRPRLGSFTFSYY